MESLTLRILDKTYQIACNENEREDLGKAALYLEKNLIEVNRSGKIIGPERAAIVAALNISYELMQANKSSVNEAAHRQRIEKLQSEVRDIVDKYKQTSL